MSWDNRQAARNILSQIVEALLNEEDYITVPMSDAVKCPLLALARATKAIEERSIRAALGSIIHERLKPRCLKEVSVGVQVTDGVRLKGVADFICDDFVVELKTTRAQPQSPRIEHLLQLSVYMDILKRRGLLVYLSWDGQVVGWVMEEPLIRVNEVIVSLQTAMKRLLAFEEPIGFSGPWCEYCPLRKYPHRMVKVEQKWRESVHNAKLARVVFREKGGRVASNKLDSILNRG